MFFFETKDVSISQNLMFASTYSAPSQRAIQYCTVVNHFLSQRMYRIVLVLSVYTSQYRCFTDDVSFNQAI